MNIIKASDKKSLEIAVLAIKNGQVLVCPTDTVYGLICDATNEAVVEKIFAIKNRPKDKPLPVFVKNIEIAKELAEINEKQENYLQKVWPGKTTAILKFKNQNSKIKIAGQNLKINETIGLRMPNSKFILDLIGKLGLSLAETSANISGQPATTKISEVLKQFEGQKIQPDLVLDAGDLPEAKASQVVDLTSESPKIIRE